MKPDDEFRTIAGTVRSERRVQGSRFIATASQILTKEEAESFINLVRKEYSDASHHCYAYRIGSRGDEYRYNDDGEPAGSAGKAILSAIDKFDLTNIVIVVTRYFGGTKLGIGGLMRAYRDSAEDVLEAVRIVSEFVMDQLTVTFPHSRTGDVMHVVSKVGARIVDTVYEEDVHLTIKCRRSRLNEIQAMLIDQTQGNIVLKLHGDS